MTGIDYFVLISGLLIAGVTICCLPWLCERLIRSLHHSLRHSSGGGSAFNPLHEMVQPQARHVIEVQQHRHAEAPPAAPPENDNEPPQPNPGV